MWITVGYIRSEGTQLKRVFTLNVAQHCQDNLRKSTAKRTLRAFALDSWKQNPHTGIALAAKLRQGLR